MTSEARSGPPKAAARGNHVALTCFLIFAAAFALRFVAATAFAAEPVWDGHYYDFGARRIAEGHGYSDDRIVDGVAIWHPWCHYPVGYSAYLAFFYRLFGATISVANVANAFAGALLALVTYLLAREALSPRRAIIAGALVAVHPGLVLYGALSMSEPLSALLVLLAFLVAVVVERKVERKRVWLAPFAGALVLGIAVLVRPQALLCAPFLALIIRDLAWKKRTLVAALACAVTLLPVLPWTARNCRVMDGCALVSTNAGWNLAIGAFPRATGRFETLRATDGCPHVVGQVQQDRCWFAFGKSEIRRDPRRWLALIPVKLAFTFDKESFPIDYLGEARPHVWPEKLRAKGRLVLTTFHRVLVVLSVFAGVAVALPRRAKRRPALAQTAVLAVVVLFTIVALSGDEPSFWPVALLACVIPFVPTEGRPQANAALLAPIGLVATTALVHAVFFGEDRYHLVATPVLCLLAAAAFRAPAVPTSPG